MIIKHLRFQEIFASNLDFNMRLSIYLIYKHTTNSSKYKRATIKLPYLILIIRSEQESGQKTCPTRNYSPPSSVYLKIVMRRPATQRSEQVLFYYFNPKQTSLFPINSRPNHFQGKTPHIELKRAYTPLNA